MTNPHRPLTTLALAVLELLHERPMHPYELHQTIRDRHTDRVIKLRAGSLYHTVERLHRTELIRPVETGRAGRRPERTVYAVTEAGRAVFNQHLRDLVQRPVEEYPVFGAAMQMLHKLAPDEAVELLEHRAVTLEADLALRDQLLTSLTKRGVQPAHLIEVEYAQAMVRAELTWIRQLVEDIRSGALPWPDRME
ncbi:PadR family transcriptional regulator [Micromonospora zhanjiangensis]|uniref:PadR family transcriptional regulator n=1 Tax=Micromonospora zhanjiangensis TaxID=1522057 RepID=A0ABV8KV50_9ACTN